MARTSGGGKTNHSKYCQHRGELHVGLYITLERLRNKNQSKQGGRKLDARDARPD
jgi:hypothetical protein